MTRLLHSLRSFLRALVEQRKEMRDPKALSAHDISLSRLADGSYGFPCEWEAQ